MTTTWKIEALDVKPQDGDLTNVVITAHWRCSAVQDDKVASVYSTCSFQQPEDSFVPYDELTEEQVIQWCWNAGVDQEATELAAQSQLDSLLNPPIVQQPLPWLQTEVVPPLIPEVVPPLVSE